MTGAMKRRLRQTPKGFASTNATFEVDCIGRVTLMATEQKQELRLAIAHVLFVDIVGYSKLLTEEQSEALQRLNELVRAALAFREAEAANQLISLPTGDGIALIFTSTAEAPVECALQLSEALAAYPEIKVRMGVHSGPVHEVPDVNQRTNVAGAGINMAQRVMDCGDAGHILLSQRVADDLSQYRHWQSCLHPVGECEVKHGVAVSVVNLFTETAGNPDLPAKFTRATAQKHASSPMGKIIGIAAIVILILGGTIWFAGHRSSRSAAHLHAAFSSLTAEAQVPDKSIAVLPFENLSDEKQNAYFADGVQNEILTDLAKVADLKVISRTSVLPYKSGAARNLREIGKQLGVAHLLEGSVQRAANRIRVNAQLIDARSDAHLWAQTYDRDLADVFAIQSEIAKAIADQLQAKILPAEKLTMEKQPTKDIAAYDLYVRGTELIDGAQYSDTSRKNLLQGIGFLEQAIARDPSFLRAYCKLAEAHDQLYLGAGDHTAARLASAGEAVNAALRLQPDAPEAHLALARHLYSKLDYDGARTEIEIARRNLPNEPRIFECAGYIDRRQGRWPESTRNLERALELDPNNIVILQQIAESYDNLREYAKAVAALNRVLALRPKDFDTRLTRAQIEILWKANPKPLHELIETFLRDNPRSGTGIAGFRIFLALSERDAEGGQRALADLAKETYGPDALQHPAAYGAGVFARLKGDTVAAETHFLKARALQQNVVEAQPDYGPALCVLGEIDAALGRKEDALREGRRAAELLPPTKDSINGVHIMARLGLIYAWVGEKDLAIDQLTRAMQFPGAPNYGVLRLFPDWDPLRGDPRFEKLVESLAPMANEMSNGDK
jgi:TolB-like protein/class 3 adenylate cyclase/Tfp pilus assembly protein PilF